MQNAQNIYALSQDDLKKMVNESVVRILLESQEDEAFLGIDFGIDERKDNRLKTIKYAKLFTSLANKVDMISNELSRRAKILQIAFEDENGQINEGIPGKAVGLATKGLTKLSTKIGGKTARRIITGSMAAYLAADFAGVPQAISQKVQKFKNPGQAIPKEVIEAYDELAQWMIEICNLLEKYPEIIGANAISDAVKNGPEEAESGPWITAGDAIGMAASIGATFIPGIGPAIGLLYDVVDIAASFISAGAMQDKEGLAVVEKQYAYISKAVSEINVALTNSKNVAPSQAQAAAGQSANPQAATGQGTSQQADTAGKRPLPQGYAMNRQPSNLMDKSKLLKFQQFMKVKPTGVWDRPTQAAWNEWLNKTYQIG